MAPVSALLCWALLLLTARAHDQICNGFAELCSRKYSNITHVTAHNSPFNEFGNPGSNQIEGVVEQLNEGVRMLQLQTHLEDGAVRMCHTSCALLDAGPLLHLFRTVKHWLDVHPSDVVTILIGNADNLPPQNFSTLATSSGLDDLAYSPPEATMPLDSWPTLGEMIAAGKRAVIMLDYGARPTEVPWLIDEFSVLWETPFSPTDESFPCVPQRPPDDPQEVRNDRMYMLNHNLNANLSGLLVPYWTRMDEVNADRGIGSLGYTTASCTRTWPRPPTFLLADFVFHGNFRGSVMSVAAQANGLDFKNYQRITNDASPATKVNTCIFAFLIALTLIVGEF